MTRIISMLLCLTVILCLLVGCADSSKLAQGKINSNTTPNEILISSTFSTLSETRDGQDSSTVSQEPLISTNLSQSNSLNSKNNTSSKTSSKPNKSSTNSTNAVLVSSASINSTTSTSSKVDNTLALQKKQQEKLDMENNIADQNDKIIYLNSLLTNYQKNLADANTALERAKTQRTMRVYYADKGWVYEADPYVVKSAQDKVDSWTSLVNQCQNLINSNTRTLDSYRNQLAIIEKEIEQLKI